MPAPIVIYDGECNFCLQSVNWVSKKLDISSISFQRADLAKYGLTLEECGQQVFVIDGDKKYSAIDAVIFLLKKRGNRLLSKSLKLIGPLSSWGYFWVASHRSSLLVRLLGRILSRLSK
jgi:predicted DCC family thiol-disulfide oxidoreductase YuxK